MSHFVLTLLTLQRGRAQRGLQGAGMPTRFKERPRHCACVFCRTAGGKLRIAMRALPCWWPVVGTKPLGQAGVMTPESFIYPGYRFPAEVIQHAVWLYHVFSLSPRDVELILAERGIVVTHESIRR